jgi:preprotein translocase subunit SecE
MFKNLFHKIAGFLSDVQVEMSKVSWPTREELMNSTIIVTIVSIIFTLFIFFADFILGRIIGYLL